LFGLYLLLNVLDNKAEQFLAIRLDIARVEECFWYCFGAAKVFTHCRVLQDAGILRGVQPPGGDGRDALLVVPYSNAVPDMLEKAKALHVNFRFSEVHAKKSFLDLLSTVLGKLPGEDAAPFLWLSVVKTVAEGSEVVEAIAGGDDAVWQWRLARITMSPDAGGKAKLRVSWAAMDECAQAAGKTMPTDLSAGFWRRCSECGDVCCEGSARMRE
jgi:hypothetical protein